MVFMTFGGTIAAEGTIDEPARAYMCTEDSALVTIASIMEVEDHRYAVIMPGYSGYGTSVSVTVEAESDATVEFMDITGAASGSNSASISEPLYVYYEEGDHTWYLSPA